MKLSEWHVLRMWRQENLEFEARFGSCARACLNKAKPSKAKQSNGRRNKLRLLDVKNLQECFVEIKKTCFYVDVHILVRTLNEMIIIVNQMSVVVSSQLPPFSLCGLSNGEST